MSEILTDLMVADRDLPLCLFVALASLPATAWLARQLVTERKRNAALVDQLLELSVYSAKMAEKAAQRKIRKAARKALGK